MDNVVRSMGRDLPLVRAAPAEVAARSCGAFAKLDRDSREALINDAFGPIHPATVLVRQASA